MGASNFVQQVGGPSKQAFAWLCRVCSPHRHVCIDDAEPLTTTIWRLEVGVNNSSRRCDACCFKWTQSLYVLLLPPPVYTVLVRSARARASREERVRSSALLCSADGREANAAGSTQGGGWGWRGAWRQRQGVAVAGMARAGAGGCGGRGWVLGRPDAARGGVRRPHRKPGRVLVARDRVLRSKAR